jgi:hypothetical protein
MTDAKSPAHATVARRSSLVAGRWTAHPPDADSPVARHPVKCREESTAATSEPVPGTRSNEQAWTIEASHRVPGTDTRVRRGRRCSDAPSPRSASRGYSRPAAAVNCRHQRVAVWPAPSLSDPLGHGHERCRRQVARCVVPRSLRLAHRVAVKPRNDVPGTTAGGAVVGLAFASTA